MINSPVQQIKERLPIEDVVSSYIKLERSGKNLKAKCPFHSEKTPSFFISSERGTYYCFGCGASGDIFSFVEEFEGLDFKGALKILAERAGVKLSAYRGEKEGEKERILEALEAAARHFEKNLKENKRALEYLKSRGLEEKSLTEFRVGFAEDSWQDLYDHLREKNFKDEEIERAGLAKRSEQNENKGRFYDRFRSRIMFPIEDSSGRVIAFSGRLFGEDLPTGRQATTAKYLNSPETPVFQKNAVLYGINRAKDSIRKNNFAILVEGQMDLILAHQAGYRNTVAGSGTALSDATISSENVVSNLGLVRRLSPNIVLGYDGDNAGLKATERSAKIALALGMDVKVASMPEGMDPADVISKLGKDAWRTAIKDSKHVIEFFLHKVLQDFADPRKAARAVKEKVLPFVNALDSAIEQAHFVKKISEETGIPETAIEEDLRKVEKEEGHSSLEIRQKEEAAPKTFRKDNIIRKLLGIALWQKTLREPVLDSAGILEKLDKEMPKYQGSEEDLIFEAEVFFENDENLKESTREMFLNLEEENLNEEISKKMFELKKGGDPGQSSEILKIINELSRKKEEIKNNREKK